MNMMMMMELMLLLMMMKMATSWLNDVEDEDKGCFSC